MSDTARKNPNEMSRSELVHELEELQEAYRRVLSDLNAGDRERTIAELEIHQIELEMQNRELRESQQLLEASRAKYADLYDLAPVGYCTLDRDGLVQDINLAAAALLGAPREKLIGCSLRAILQIQIIQFPAFLSRCAEGKQAIGEFSFTSQRGTSHAVQLICSPSGQEGEVLAAIVDITQHKQLERELRLLSNIGEALIGSLDYRLTFAAAARVVVPSFAQLLLIDLVGTGGSPERFVYFADEQRQNALGERFRQFVPLPGWRSAQAQVIESGEPMLLSELSDAVRGRLGQNATHAALMREAAIQSMIVVPMKVPGRTLGAMTFATIGANRRYSPWALELAKMIGYRTAMSVENSRLHNDMKRAVGARDATLAAVSHDLRNPLNVFGMMADRMMRDPEPESRKVAGMLRRGVDHMERLVQDLLDVASIDAGKLRLHKARHQVRTLVERALESVRPEADKKSQQLKSDLGVAGSLEIKCDAARIQQVLVNLIHNSSKFTEPGGSIAVSVESSEGHLRFSVTDSGKGIPGDMLPRIFNLFWQGDSAERGSRGLGLSIAKGIVAGHGGEIWAESRPGRGSTFSFTVPISSPQVRGPVPSKAADDSRSQRARSAGPAVILVVDDDEDARAMVGMILEESGYEVVARANGAEALEYLHRAPPPSCILLDLMMPVMNGWDFLNERTRDAALQAIPIVVVSGAKDGAEAAEQYGTDFLQKPLSPERIVEATRRFVHA